MTDKLGLPWVLPLRAVPALDLSGWLVLDAAGKELVGDLTQERAEAIASRLNAHEELVGEHAQMGQRWLEQVGRAEKAEAQVADLKQQLGWETDRLVKERDALREALEVQAEWIHREGIRGVHHDRHGYDFDSCNSLLCVHARAALAQVSR